MNTHMCLLNASWYSCQSHTTCQLISKLKAIGNTCVNMLYNVKQYTFAIKLLHRFEEAA